MKLLVALLVLFSLGGGTYPPRIQAERGENKFNWAWEEAESRDVICSKISASGNYVICGTHNTTIGPLRPDFGYGVYVCIFERQRNMPVAYYEIERDNVEIKAIACSYDAEIIVFVVENAVYVIDRQGAELWHKELAYLYRDSVAISMDGNWIAVANYTDDGGYSGPTLFYFSLASSTPLWSRYLNDGLLLGGVDISDDGQHVVAITSSRGGRDPRVYYFDAESLNPADPEWVFINASLPATNIAFDMSLDGRYIALVTSGDIYFFDDSKPLQDDKTPLWVQEGGGYDSTLHDAALSDDGSLLVYAGPYLVVGLDIYMGTLELWDTSGEGAKVWELEHYLDRPYVSMSSSGHYIYYGGNVQLPQEPRLTLVSLAGQEIWYYPVCGRPTTDLAGLYTSVGQGVVVGYNYRDYHPLMLFAAEVNQEPLCQITQPEPGTEVTDFIELTGTAEDLDGSLTRVIAGYDGLYLEAEDTSGGTWATWSLEFDLRSVPDGELLITAESIDDRYKYSYPAELAVTVRNSTPAATYTQSATRTPTPSPTVSPTQTVTPAYDETVFRLLLNAGIFVGGDVLQLVAESYNAGGQQLWVNQVVLLDVYGTFYFHPNWTQEFDYTERYLVPQVQYFEPLLAVSLPYELDPGGPFYFFGAILTEEDWLLICDITVVGFIFM